MDMYRRVPTDLTEGTGQGSVFSYIAVMIMLTLFLLETREYMQKTAVASVQLDKSDDPRIRVNFNITMMDLKCEFAVVDVVSSLGTEQNVSTHVTKWHVDGGGIRRRYQGRNKHQTEIELHDETVTATLDDLYANGEDAVSLDEETFEYAKSENEYLFVDFYASWCSHCRQLAPTWETLAEVMTDVAEHIVDQREHEYSEDELAHAKKVELPVMIAKVDCVDHKALCMTQQLMAYPTLRLFVDGERWPGGDYRGHRTVAEMADWLQQVEDKHKEELGDETKRNVQLAHKRAQDRLESGEKSGEEVEWAEKVKRRRQRMHHSWVDDEHPGCQLAGHLLLDRAPGNFHVQARSPHHDLVPHMTNVSHQVHHLSVGEPFAERLMEENSIIPPQVRNKLKPMNGNAYVTFELHEAFHHYIKIVTTNVEGLKRGNREFKAYQILQNSQLSYYRNDVVPEAKFMYDLSPIAVSYEWESRNWYDYLTSVMAIIGGTFTVVGLIESSITKVTTGTRRITKKMSKR